MRQAIETKYLGPTDHHGSRYRARRRWNVVRLAFEAIGAAVFMALIWLGLVVLVAVGFSR